MRWRLGLFAVMLVAALAMAGCQSVETRHDEAKVDAAQTRQKAANAGSAVMMAHEAMAPPPLPAPAGPRSRAKPLPADREQYQVIEANPVKLVAKDPVCTFSVDVDTGSYANVRRFLRAGQLPRHDAVRVEEMINYFPYDYAPPADRSRPFAASLELLPTPWNSGTLLLRVGLKGYEVAHAQRPPANLVFLLDVSGSMDEPDKLPLLKSAFKLLCGQLTAQDRVSIVVYAGAAGVVLEPTPGDQKAKIMAALDQLAAGGSTAGGQGIQLAYAMARQAFIKGGINRILLATDGDFNVGLTDFRALLNLVERQRQDGIGLTTLGFGQGNYNERLMEQLADKGNGNHAYIDTLSEANKVLVQQVSSTLFTIAQDVKAQIEFNPAVVAEYRLIGYENRVLASEDFKNDKVDAGDIGAGHTVTVLFEIALVGDKGQLLEPPRYGQKTDAAKAKHDELAFLKLRYKLPGQTASKLIELPVDRKLIRPAIDQASTDSRWAAAVAAFGQILAGGKHTGQFGYDDVTALAQAAKGDDPFGYRGEFLSLVALAKSLDVAAAPATPAERPPADR